MSRPAISIGAGQRPQSLVVSIGCGTPLAAFAAQTQKLRMPQKGLIVGVTLNVGQRGGTHVTSTLDIQNGVTSILAALFNVATLTPGTPVDKEGAALAAAAGVVVAKDAALSIITAQAGGTSPTWADVTVQIDYIPLGD
jgi:hypothetical protein